MSIIQKVRFKLEHIKSGMQDRIHHGREVSEQMRAESLRKKNEKILNSKPSAVNTVRKHLLMRTTNPFEVAKDELSRRKYERKNK